MVDMDIFTIWLTNKDWDAMPYLYEICIASMQVFNPNKKVVIYTNNELHLSFLDRKITEVRKLQDYFPDEYKKAIELTDNKAHQSDYIRYNILLKNFGIFFDCDVLCYKSVDSILFHLKDTQHGILFPMEDSNMICNAFLIKEKNTGNKVLQDILTNYEKNYIKHSYLFNSQKYLHLMSRRYSNDVFLYNENKTIFKPDWLLRDAEINKLLDSTINYNEYEKLGFKGIGFHLYSSIQKGWGDMRLWIDQHLYDEKPNTFISKLTKYIIDQYILLMKEVDNEQDKK